MAKKPLAISIASILTLTMLAAPPSVYASDPAEELDYWSFDEVVAFKDEVVANLDLECGDDPYCREEHFYEYLFSGDSKYLAVDSLAMPGIKITRFNPVNETLSVYYHDTKIISDFFDESLDPEPLTELYLAWLETSISDPFEDMSWIDAHKLFPYYVDISAERESRDGVHTLVAENYDLNGPDWVFIPNVEHHYSIAGSDIVNDERQRIYDSHTLPNGKNTIGSIDYSSCYNHPEYEAGVDCVLAYDKSGVSTFVPATVFEVAGFTDILETNMDTDKNTTNYTTDTTEPNSNPAIHAPNTGRITSGESDAFEFPWWLTAIAILNIAILIWLFWPDCEVRKHLKNCKKA